MADPLDIVDEVAQNVAALLAQTLEDALVAQYLAAITGPVSQVALDRARALAANAADSLIRDLTTAQLNSMGETIATALAQGKRPIDIAQKLTEVQGLDRNRAAQFEKITRYLEESGLSDADLEKRLEREYQRLLKERRETIANTEGRQATSTAREVEALERGGKYKHWITTPDERLCDQCAGNEAAGVIPIDESFPDGSDRTPAHPNCRCSIAYVTTERGKGIAEEINAANQAETNAAREGNI
jgi:septal ring factor EnvC (AmiA/AmiB activator)